MTFSPNLYKKRAPIGFNQTILDRVIQLERSISAGGAKPVYTLNHLAKMTGTSFIYLRQVVGREIDGYKVFEVRKRDGVSFRSIAAPTEELRKVQKWLLVNVFSGLESSPYSFAYKKEVSAQDAARTHLGAKWLLRLDLKDFFHQTDERDVFTILQQVGYTDLLSFEIARIVTRSVQAEQKWLPEKYARPYRVKAGRLPYSMPAHLGYLPQGAATSGCISNLLAEELDAALAKAAASLGLTYSRYADDLSFSSYEGKGSAFTSNAVGSLTRVIAAHGYEVNAKKTSVARIGGRIEMLGMLVDGEELRLAPRTKARVERHLSGLERFGVERHRLHCGFRDSLGMRNHIAGLIAYCHAVEPDRAARYGQRLNKVFPIP